MLPSLAASLGLRRAILGGMRGPRDRTGLALLALLLASLLASLLGSREASAQPEPEAPERLPDRPLIVVASSDEMKRSSTLLACQPPSPSRL